MEEEMEGCVLSPDFQIYCNYPEISKTVKACICSEDSSSVTSTTSSSVLPSLNSDVSDPLSQPSLFHAYKHSSSVCNYLRCSLPCVGSTSFDENVKTITYKCIELEEYHQDDDVSTVRLPKAGALLQSRPLVHDELEIQGRGLSEEIKFELNSKDELESENCFTSSSVEESVTSKESIICKIVLSNPQLEGWLKYAIDHDPWNNMYYDLTFGDLSRTSTLTHQLIATCSSQIGQLPDTKSFVLTRLHINKKGLKDISILSEYKYFQYVDISWNSISDLKALNNLNYLMYLNASHNKLSTVLDLWPPWFLTYADLSCNEIKVIGSNLSSFWSLRHFDLSNNLIQKIEGLGDLRYLRYLNLSHNHIKRIENLDCCNVEELHLEFNEISDCDLDGMNLRGLTQIKILTLGHNKMSSLQPFEQLYSLIKLDMQHNCLTNLHEISFLAGLRKLYEVNLSKNVFCSTCSYRELVIFKIPSLKVLDTIPISSCEQVAAKMLFGPYMFTSVQHLRTKIELWNQLAPQEIGSETMPMDDLPMPLVILVGTFLNNKEEIANRLVLKLPNQIYRFKKYTTIPSTKNFESSNMVSVSVDQFNLMIKNGKFLFYYKEVGFFFGVLRDELCQCILHNRIGLSEMPLEAALILKSSGLYPLLILTYVDNKEIYSDRLKCHYMNLELWHFQSPKFLEERILIDQKEHGAKSDLFIFNEKKRFCQEEMGSLSCANTELTNHMTSSQTTLEDLGEFADQTPAYKSSTFCKSVTWNLSKSSKESDSEDSVQTSKSLTISQPLDECTNGDAEGEIETLTQTSQEEEKGLNDGEDKEHENSKKKIIKIPLSRISKKNYKYLIESNESESKSSESISVLEDEINGKKSTGTDSFEWVWKYESSTTTESEPDENCLNMLKGREKFVRDTLQQQELYIEANQLQPALFITTVPADDIQGTLPTIEQACYEILKSRQRYKHFEYLTSESELSLIEDRLSGIMKDFYNIPNTVKF